MDDDEDIGIVLPEADSGQYDALDEVACPKVVQHQVSRYVAAALPRALAFHCGHDATGRLLDSRGLGTHLSSATPYAYTRPLACPFPCYNCHDRFDGPPITVAFELPDRTQAEHGLFCSFPCGWAFIHHYLDDCFGAETPALTLELWERAYGWAPPLGATVPISPHFSQLDSYGGPVALDTVRASRPDPEALRATIIQLAAPYIPVPAALEVTLRLRPFPAPVPARHSALERPLSTGDAAARCFQCHRTFRATAAQVYRLPLEIVALLEDDGPFNHTGKDAPEALWGVFHSPACAYGYLHQTLGGPELHRRAAAFLAYLQDDKGWNPGAVLGQTPHFTAQLRYGGWLTDAALDAVACRPYLITSVLWPPFIPTQAIVETVPTHVTAMALQEAGAIDPAGVPAVDVDPVTGLVPGYALDPRSVAENPEDGDAVNDQELEEVLGFPVALPRRLNAWKERGIRQPPLRTIEQRMVSMPHEPRQQGTYNLYFLRKTREALRAARTVAGLYDRGTREALEFLLPHVGPGLSPDTVPPHRVVQVVGKQLAAAHAAFTAAVSASDPVAASQAAFHLNICLATCDVLHPSPLTSVTPSVGVSRQDLAALLAGVLESRGEPPQPDAFCGPVPMYAGATVTAIPVHPLTYVVPESPSTHAPPCHP